MQPINNICIKVLTKRYYLIMCVFKFIVIFYRFFFPVIQNIHGCWPKCILTMQIVHFTKHALILVCLLNQLQLLHAMDVNVHYNSILYLFLICDRFYSFGSRNNLHWNSQTAITITSSVSFSGTTFSLHSGNQLVSFKI